MAYQNAQSGQGNVAEFMISPLPFVTQSNAVTSSLTRIDFPYITRHFSIRNNGASSIKFGFTVSGTLGSDAATIPANTTFGPVDMRMKTLYVMSVSGTNAFDLLAGMTLIQTNSFPILTGSSPIPSTILGIGSPGRADDTNIYAWFRADSNVLSGNNISQLTDISGRGRHLTQLTGSSQPFLSSSHISYKDKPVVHFDGSDWLTAASAWSLVQPFTVYIIGEQDSASPAYGTYFDGIDSNRLIVRRSTTFQTLDIYGGSSITPEPILDQTSKKTFCVTFNRANSTVHDSGSVQIGTGSLANILLGTPRVGAGVGFAYPLVGKIAELVFFQGAHNGTQRTAVLDYFEERYWTPSSYAGMHAWWSARSVITGSAGLISQVNDLSGRNKHLIQTVESKRPSLNLSSPSLNSKPTILFQGAQVLETAATHNIPREHTIFFVLGHVVTRGMLLEHGTVSSIQINSTGNTAVTVYGSATVSSTQNPRTTWASANQQGNAKYDRVSAPELRGNKTTVTPTSTSGTSMTLSTLGAKWFLGAKGDLTQPMNAEIAEIIIFERALTLAEIQKVEAYLTTIYGV